MGMITKTKFYNQNFLIQTSVLTIYTNRILRPVNKDEYYINSRNQINYVELGNQKRNVKGLILS